MNESLEQMKRREKAIEIARAIMHHPAYPFGADDFPRAMVVIIERGLAEWEKKRSE